MVFFNDLNNIVVICFQALRVIINADKTLLIFQILFSSKKLNLYVYIYLLS